MAGVVLEHLEKVFSNGVRAVDDLTLDVADGELMVLVGPSGCGKTTTLRMIAGLETVTRGTIAIDGRVVNQLRPKDRNLAMVFQSYALYPHMTCRGNMAFPLLLRKTPKPETGRRVSDAARVLGIEHLLDRKPRQLSGGERQRVALGRALVRDPACLLLDEPLSQLDARLRQEMRSEIKRLHREFGRTILHVTHDQEEAMTLGSRLAVVKDGRLQQVGAPLEIYQRPVNRFVAAFIGSPPMNFLDGTILADQGRLWFDDGAQRMILPDWAVPALTAKVARRVVLGIRPEAISEGPIQGQTGNILNVQVAAIEPLGSATEVCFCSDRRMPITARLGPQTWLSLGQVLPVYVDLAQVHLFDADDAPGRPGASLLGTVRF